MKEHLMARLSQSIRRYPATAGMILGEDALRRRNQWNSRNSAAVNIALAAASGFPQWRDDLMEARSGAGA